MAVAGNCVVIDHGDSEYSVLMHMQLGSVRVMAGDKVAGGQVIGKMGNSGEKRPDHTCTISYSQAHGFFKVRRGCRFQFFKT